MKLYDQLKAQHGQRNQGRNLIDTELQDLIYAIKTPLGLSLIGEVMAELLRISAIIESEKGTERTWGEFRAYKRICDKFADKIYEYENPQPTK